MSARKMGRSSNAIDPELAEAQAKITAMEQTTDSLQKTVEEREATIQELERKLEDAEKNATAVKTEAQETIEAHKKEVEVLRQQQSESEARVIEKDKKCTTMENQLKIAMDGTSRMQTELQTAQRNASRYAEETKILNAQLSQALKDLTMTKEELAIEQESKVQLEEGKSKAERALEAMMVEMQRHEHREMPISQLWITAAMTACGTACVISLLFMKYYSKF